MKRSYWLVLSVVVVLICGGAGYAWYHFSREPAHHQDVRRLQAGRLVFVEFEPGLEAEIIRSEDKEFLAKVETWFGSLEEPGRGDYLRNPYFRLTLGFADGHQEQMTISVTTFPRGQIPYVTVAWNDHILVSHRQPFTEYWRASLPQRPVGAEVAP